MTPTGRFVVVALLIPAGVCAQAADSVRAFVLAHMEWREIPAVVIAVAHGGRVLRVDALGFASLEPPVRATSEMSFHWGSVGKQFTAAAVLLLAEEGRLRLNDSIHQFFPHAPASWRGMTVRQLLSHTSGLQNYVDSLTDFQKEYSEADLFRLIASQPLVSAPGRRFRYSNSGYVLLGLIVQQVAGQHLGDVLRDRVFRPLEMHTAMLAGAPGVARSVIGYRRGDSGTVPTSIGSASLNRTGDGGLQGTIGDLLKWDAALYRDHPLSRTLREAMWTRSRLSDGRTVPYGLGWTVRTEGQRRVVEHGGVWQGFSAYITRYLDDSMTVIVLANRSGIGNTTGLIANAVARFHIADLRANAWRLPVRVASDTRRFAAYVGAYEFNGERVLIEAESTRLFVRLPRRGRAELLATSAGEFAILPEPLRFRFVRSRHDTTAVDLEIIESSTYRARRVRPND